MFLIEDNLKVALVKFVLIANLQNYFFLNNGSYLNLAQKVGTWLMFLLSITKNAYIIFDPLKPHFYIVKLGFAGVYIVVEAVLTSTHNLCFEQSMPWAEI